MSETRAVPYTYIAPPLPGLLGMVQRSTDNAFIPCDLANTDYQAFLAWISEGNAAPSGWTGPTNTSPSTG